MISVFSEEITISSAEQINNYSLPNVIFTDAELMEDQRTVRLTMNTDQFDATTMGVFNIEDDNSPPNTIDWQVVWIESPEPMTSALINIGGDSAGNYLNDQVWGPSRQYGHEGGNYEIVDEFVDIGGTTNDAVYRASLNRVASYKIRLVPGYYDLNLMFSDNHYTSSGDRVFDIIIEDSLWFDDLDVINEVGSMTSHEVLFERVLVSDGILDIYFSAEIYGFGYVYAGPFLNGLEIELDELLSVNFNTPDKYDLNRPYPNPFNNNLKIPIDLMIDSQIKVDILDVTGRIRDTIFDGNMKSGKNILEWRSRTHASGMYIVRTTINNKRNYEKTILLK
ncbi:MAG: malectin domain-containing carbohydrate-binding protein [Candidatus Neomarinimicrobiota bacterium]